MGNHRSQQAAVGNREPLNHMAQQQDNCLLPLGKEPITRHIAAMLRHAHYISLGHVYGSHAFVGRPSYTFHIDLY
ncbi:MAG: hypothetical protein Q7U57_03990 [Methylovulum sp.]|nr:hypothetical protein [Methylovulum sp.]